MNNVRIRYAVVGLLSVGLLAVSTVISAQGQPPAQPTVTPTRPSPQSEPSRPELSSPQQAPERKELPAAHSTEVKNVLAEIRRINATEIEAGKLAEKRASKEELKSFGRQLIEDHQKADEKVVQLARKYNLALPGALPAARESSGMTSAMGMPTKPVALNSEGRKTMAKLSKARGAKFDQEFVNAMVEGHQKALALISGSKERIDNGDVQSVLGEIQSSVEKHLDHAKGLQQESPAKTETSGHDSTREGRQPTATPIPSPAPRH